MLAHKSTKSNILLQRNNETHLYYKVDKESEQIKVFSWLSRAKVCVISFVYSHTFSDTQHEKSMQNEPKNQVVFRMVSLSCLQSFPVIKWLYQKYFSTSVYEPLFHVSC